MTTPGNWEMLYNKANGRVDRKYVLSNAHVRIMKRRTAHKFQHITTTKGDLPRHHYTWLYERCRSLLGQLGHKHNFAMSLQADEI